MEEGIVIDYSFSSSSPTSLPALESTSNIFEQLDSMIRTVRSESTAFDAMKEKLKELEAIRTQLVLLTQRCLESEQNNLVLRTNIIKLQEAYFFEANTRRHTKPEMLTLSAECWTMRTITERKGWEGECIC